MTWSADAYRRFEDERTRPVRDLVAAIPTPTAATAIDLGCGPGNSTEVLAARYPDARVSGLDNSPDMIAAARRRLPQLDFALGDLTTWNDPGPYDVILSNAVLHWTPGHADLLPRLVQRLAPGGTLAIQMPDNEGEPSHLLMARIAAEDRWRAALAGAAAARAPIATADWYFALLATTCRRVEVWRTTYYHRLAGPEAIVEWFKSTGLRPYLQPLLAGDQEAFLAAYRAGVAAAYPPLPDGGVLLPFPRLFMVATR